MKEKGKPGRNRELVEEYSRRLEEGVRELADSEHYKKWLRTMARFPRYSWKNVLLIMCQYPGATRVCGFNAWKDLGRSVKKGEKALRIFAPMVRKKNDADDAETEEKEVFGYRAVPVFDLSQTEGEDLPESPCRPLEGSYEGYAQAVDLLRQASPCEVRFGDFPGNANGYFFNGGKGKEEPYIMVREGMPEQQTVKTMVHEIAHAMLHSCHDGMERPHAVKETEAESVAYCVCQFLGIDSGDYSFGYVADYAEGDAMLLKQVMAHVKDAAGSIICKYQDCLAERRAMMQTHGDGMESDAPDVLDAGWTDLDMPEACARRAAARR